MSLAARLADIADDGAANGAFRTSNLTHAQTDAERRRQEDIVNKILDELDLLRSDVSGLEVDGSVMRFVLPTGPDRLRVVHRNGGRIVEADCGSGPKVEIPLYFDPARKLRIFARPAFMLCAGAALLSGLWLAARWSADDQFWHDLAASYGALLGRLGAPRY